jgi:kynurenine formamidase
MNMQSFNKDVTREEIIAYTRQTRNWGRWGENDQMGALNLIDDAKRQRAATLVRSGRSVSLSRHLPTEPAVNNTKPAMMYMEKFHRHPDAGGAKDFQGMSYHGTSATHIDALCHVWDIDGMWNGRDPEKEISIEGATWGSIDQWRNGILTRGVLIDIPAFRGVPFVTQDQPVHGWELAAAIEKQGVTIEPGDAIAIYCGREESDRVGPVYTADPTTRPGLEATCLKFFRETDCAAILWDMWDTRPGIYNLPFPVHAAIYAYGVAVVDSALLEPLAKMCVEENRYEFMLSMNPLFVKGATGSLINPVAFF